MLLVAAVLTVAVGLMHSLLGGARLVEPIIRMDGLPVILGSLRNTRLTLRLGWHVASLTWWGLAAILGWMHLSPGSADRMVLATVAVIFGISGTVALAASRGAHLSWMLFLPVAAIAAHAAVLAAP